RGRHTISKRDWSSDVCSSDLLDDLRDVRGGELAGGGGSAGGGEGRRGGEGLPRHPGDRSQRAHAEGDVRAGVVRGDGQARREQGEHVARAVGRDRDLGRSAPARRWERRIATSSSSLGVASKSWWETITFTPLRSAVSTICATVCGAREASMSTRST